VKFDRYGGRMENGRFVDHGFTAGALGDSFESRSLPPSFVEKPYTRYEVVKPIKNVKTGIAAPWFGQTGGGTLYSFSKTIQQLIDGGYIRKLD
jgi:hypothetical protein